MSKPDMHVRSIIMLETLILRGSLERPMSLLRLGTRLFISLVVR